MSSGDFVSRKLRGSRRSFLVSLAALGAAARARALPKVHCPPYKGGATWSPAVTFGTGQAPIREVLLLLQRNRWKIPAFIEYEYAGKESPVIEVERTIEYCKNILDHS